MIKYTVKKVSDGRVLSEWTSDFADHTHYEENWGKPEHQIEITSSQIINHPAIPEVVAVSAHGIIPAVFDVHGTEISPAIPAQTEVIGIPGIAAWEEIIPAVTEIIPSEYTVEIIDITAEIAQKKINAEALQYLAETDCFAIRLAETGKPMPIGMVELRAAARLAIVKV